MRVAVLVPRRPDGGRRDLVWQYVRERWASMLFDVFEGVDDSDGPFNRAAAINRAAAAASAVAADDGTATVTVDGAPVRLWPEWDVAVIADADSFVGEQQLLDAINTAVRTGRITFAFDRFAYVGREMSDRIMGGYLGSWWPGVEWTMPGTCSSMVVVTRELWDAVGGFDEGFVGWGGEDVAFSLACQALGGGCERVPGEVWHLWHEPAVHTHDDVWPARIERYKVNGPDEMRELLATLRAERLLDSGGGADSTATVGDGGTPETIVPLVPPLEPGPAEPVEPPAPAASKRRKRPTSS